MTSSRHTASSRPTIRLLTVLLAPLTAAISCSSDPSAAADAICADTVPRSYSATATTVDAIRHYRVSALQAEAHNWFPGVNPSTAAAWCWVKRGQGRFSAYAAVRGQEPEALYNYEGLTRVPEGFPQRFEH